MSWWTVFLVYLTGTVLIFPVILSLCKAAANGQKHDCFCPNACPCVEHYKEIENAT